MVKNLPAVQEIWVLYLSEEDSLEKGMATHSSTLAWRTPWTEEVGRLQSMGSQRVRLIWATNTHTHRWAKPMDQFCISNLRINTKVNFPSSPELGLENGTQHQNTGQTLQKITICYSSWFFVWCLQSFPISKSAVSILSSLFLSHCHPFFLI